MFFKKKANKCDNCNSKIESKFSFCPYCGENTIDKEKYAQDYGLLGKNEKISSEDNNFGFGITDKFIGSLMNGLIKTLDKQFKHLDKEFEKAEVRSYPNGIKIKIGPTRLLKKNPRNGIFQKTITKEQLEKMNVFPRLKAETKIKRLNNSIIYELNAPGIESPEDVFISKLERGYEIKAIGKKRIFVNSLPVELPLKSISLNNDKLLIEFNMYN